MPIPSVDKFLSHPGEPPIPFKRWFKVFGRFLIMLDDGRPAAEKLTDAQRNNYLYMLLGAEGCHIFDANPAADQIDTLPYAQFAAAAQQQFQPAVNEATAYFEFYRRDQAGHESTEEYLTILRGLAADCNFGGSTDKQIAIRMVCGCVNRETQTHLLALDAVELTPVLRMMQAEEKARENAALMAKKKAPTLAIARFRGAGTQGRQERPPPRLTATTGDQCSSCGRTGHRFKDEQCPAANIDCRKCSAIGHFQRFCRSRGGGGGPRGGWPRGGRGGRGNGRRPPPTTRTVAEDGIDEEAVLRVATAGRRRALQVVEISDGQRFHKIEVELDSGADPTTITIDQYKAVCPNLPIRMTRTPLTNFDGSKIKGVHGVVDTKIRANGKIHRGTTPPYWTKTSCNTWR